jgi:hypothetical protein
LASSPARDRPGEGVEDHAEPDLEFVAGVVAGLEDVLGRHLDEVGVVVGGDLLAGPFGEFGDGFGVEGQRGLLEREP